MSQQDFSISGNLRVVGSTIVYGQVAIGNTALDLSTFAVDMIGNVNAANARVNAANSSITTANADMKTYVDATVSSAVISASGYGNTVVAAYLPINPTITSIQANMIAANANISSLRSNVIAANLNISSIQANIIASNIRAGATDSNVGYLQGLAQYMSANILSNGAVIGSNVYTDGNLIVGNINASGNLIMAGTDATTIRFVRSPDTTVTSNEIYGNIDFAGEDASIGSAGVRARISVIGSGVVGQTEMTMYTAASNSTNLVLNLRSNSQGTFAPTIGFTQSVASRLPNFAGSGFDPIMNDSSGPGGTYIPLVRYSLTGQTIQYGGEINEFREVIIAHQFRQTYAGFAGGDRANISLSAYHSHIGSIALAYTDTTQSDVEIQVSGVYVADPSVYPPVVKRLRKRILATTTYSQATGNYSVLDQQLMDPVYNSDATNWAAGAVGASKVFIQANVTVNSQALYLRLEAPTGAVATSEIYWQILTRIRTLPYQ